MQQPLVGVQADALLPLMMPRSKATRGRVRTAQAQRQSLRCSSREHPCKPPPLQTHARSIQNSVGGAECRTLGPVASTRLKKKNTWCTGLCLVIRGGGGGCQIGPPGFWLTHPPTHIRKFFLRKKMKFIKGARTWRSILGTQTFFWPLTPPPPRYSINQPLSKGLLVYQQGRGRVQNSGPCNPWLPVVENSRLFAQRGHSARCAAPKGTFTSNVVCHAAVQGRRVPKYTREETQRTDGEIAVAPPSPCLGRGCGGPV